MASSVPVDSDIATQISHAINSQSPKACLRVLSLLSRSTGKQVPDYEPSKKRLKVLAIPLLNVSELADIFSGSLTTTFEYPVPDRLRVRLLSLPNDQRDEIKHRIEENLKTNTQPFVAGTLVNPSEWIARWLLADLPVSVYLRGDTEYQKLNKNDQLRVERLLSTYQLVSHYSATIEGIDEEIVMRDETGKLRVLRNGRVMELNIDRLEDNSTSHKGVTVVLPVIEVSAPPPKSTTLPAPVNKPVPLPANLPMVTTERPVLTPKSEVIPQTQVKPDSPKFYFHEEDEADIAKHRADLSDEAQAGAGDFSHLIEKLIQDYVIQLPDEQARARFENIITARFKDVRNLIQTRDMLSRPTKIGGAGLPTEVVDQLVGQMEEEAKRVHAGQATPRPAAVAPMPKPEPPPQPQKIVTPPPIKPIEQVKPVAVTSKPAHPVVAPTRPINPPPPIIKRPIDGIRPVVSDIRPPARVMGPVEELGSLTIEDYRRLGRNLSESNDKVMEKLELLEEESFLKRHEGAKAWKNSPAHMLYLSIGRASMEKNIAVVDAIREHNASGMGNLTPQEFEALADLNKRISY